MDLSAHITELNQTGSTRIKSTEFNLSDVMAYLIQYIDNNQYSYGLCEHPNGYDYVEIIKLENE